MASLSLSTLLQGPLLSQPPLPPTLIPLLQFTPLPSSEIQPQLLYSSQMLSNKSSGSNPSSLKINQNFTMNTAMESTGTLSKNPSILKKPTPQLPLLLQGLQ
jgi:hypothetical protein